MKKLLAFLLVCLMLTALVACGDSSDGKDKKDSSKIDKGNQSETATESEDDNEETENENDGDEDDVRDYDEIVGDFKDELNDIFDLDDAGDTSSNPKDMLKEGPINPDIQFTICDEDGNTFITNNEIEKIATKFDDINGYYIELTFTQAGSEAFYEATSNNIGKTLYVFADSILLAMPTISSAINDKSVILTGFNGDFSLIEDLIV